MAGLSIPVKSPVVIGKAKAAMEGHVPEKKNPFTKEIVAAIEWLVIESELGSYAKLAASWVYLLIHGCLR